MTNETFRLYFNSNCCFNSFINSLVPYKKQKKAAHTISVRHARTADNAVMKEKEEEK